jgi:flagellar basal body-associated protein FliL
VLKFLNKRTNEQSAQKEMMLKSVLLVVVVLCVAMTSAENVTVSSHSSSSSNEITEPYLNKQFVNETNSYSAQHQPKLLMAGPGNNTLVISQARTVVVTANGGDVKANPTNTAATSTTSLVLILVSLVLITCVILIIITALFIMRRRFSIWRLNNSKVSEPQSTLS